MHTSFTDGKNTVFEICREAAMLNTPLIAFTEHVRRELTYDFNRYLEEIEKARNSFPEIIILSGIEAKVLPGGELDVEPEIIKLVDYKLFAFHSFPPDKQLYIYSLEKVVSKYPVDGWAHPGLFLHRNNIVLSPEEIESILKVLKNIDILIEINSKYRMPPKEWIKKAVKLGLNFVNGNDIHSVNDLRKVYEKRSLKIIND